MHRAMSGIFIGVVFLLNLVGASSSTFGLRLRRQTTGKQQDLHMITLKSSFLALDPSLKQPVLNALTERTAVDSSWEQCMIVAPMTIQLLGQLLIVSSTKDVSFRAFSPDRQFTYIKNPDSFRAILLQVSQGKS